ncbi:MAG: dihydrofolate reductase [Deltaproteobacteria bacterium]|jgi:dihydrofolate reductase
MIISIIAAMAENRVIGRDNSIPWNLPADLERFKTITTGHPVIMGRKTFEGIGRPLPGRKTVIITRNPDFTAEGCVVAHNLQEALAECKGADEVFICGGSEVYREALTLASRIYLTLLDGEVEGDTLFPEIPEYFIAVEREEVKENSISGAYIRYEHKDPQEDDPAGRPPV